MQKQQRQQQPQDEFLEVYQESKLEEGKPTMIRTDSGELCLVKLRGQCFAFSNTCTHIGGRLSDGKVSSQCHITCPEHRAVFDIKDGSSLSFPRRGLETFTVKVSDGKVFIGRKLPAKWRNDFQSLTDIKWKS